jgi:hypothetical protein
MKAHTSIVVVVIKADNYCLNARFSCLHFLVNYCLIKLDLREYHKFTIVQAGFQGGNMETRHGMRSSLPSLQADLEDILKQRNSIPTCVQFCAR